ncbi:MAG: hypothetical protein ACT4P1_13020 [Sporichthyaceae bacterium]
MKALVVIDDAYDREHAADGVSRFGSYVRQRAHLFIEDWDPLSPPAFAAAVWSIATSPVMTPPYARISPRLWRIDCWHGDEPGLLVVNVEVRLPWPLEYRDDTTLDGWTDWAPAQCWGNGTTQLLDPIEDRAAALFSAVLRVPIREDLLPVPCQIGTLDVSVAKCAIATIADQVNAIAAPVVAQIADLDVVGLSR